MCGIAGFVGRGNRTDLERMTTAIAHRGPDAEGHWIDAGRGVHLGHRRLSIIDLAGGAQPMWTADQRIGIIYNGEIYNHDGLREELKARGCVFQTDHSDTEVLLHAYLEWGDDFVHRLNGMWAFAIYDRDAGRLFLSRDRFGKKPLYWFHERGTFAFASELTALLAHPVCPRSVSATALRKFFAYALIPAPHSILERVWKLPAGHNLVFDLREEAPRLEKYWDFLLEPIEPAQKEDALADELLDLIDRAVTRRLMADVPLGIFLSGGIDSSLTAALAARHVPAGALRTFSIGFTEASFDELAWANRVAGLLGTNHQTEVLDLDKALEALPQIFEKLDEPQGDGSLLPTWLLSRFTRRHVAVALGGDGGDELFAGYDPFLALRKAEAYAKLMPKPLHLAIRLLAARLPVSHANLSLDFKIKRTLRGLSHPPALWNPVWLGALEAGEIADFLGGPQPVEELYSEAIELWESCPSRDVVDRTLQFYTKVYLPDGILAKVDRASMMNSLEVRAPLLDRDVADFARRLPHRFKLRRGATKYLLKRAAARVLPAEIVHRKKKGFGSPTGPWFRSGRLAPAGTDPFVRRRLAAHRAGRSDDRIFLWCQLMFEQWKERRLS
ncbi:MAG: asparagine synthase (glutamine-hydrolyzing) [Terrimicrobiaceae bacterium]|nr:asparagine synthase (glutamine-hydrolyzing) [Terrimicrobiaceae bacterium]